MPENFARCALGEHHRSVSTERCDPGVILLFVSLLLDLREFHYYQDLLIILFNMPYRPDLLVEPKPPSLSFSPRAVKNIQKRLKTLSLTNPVTVESLYGAILAIFEEHGQVKRSGTPNTPESWFRFLPGPVRLAYIDTLLLYSQFYL